MRLGILSAGHVETEAFNIRVIHYFEPDYPMTGTQGVRYGRWSFLFTMTSMVIVVNSVLGEPPWL